MTDYERGQWAAYNRILNLLNTFDTRMVEKTDLYEAIMEFRPVDDPGVSKYPVLDHQDATECG